MFYLIFLFANEKFTRIADFCKLFNLALLKLLKYFTSFFLEPTRK